MKHLCQFLIVSFLLLAGGLSAQQYRLRLDLGASGLFKFNQSAAPAATLGLEALINISPRTFFVPEVGLQQTYIFHDGLRPPPPFIAGLRVVDFNSEETYEMKRASAYVGLGVEQHLHRIRIQLFGRVVKRIADRITFREQLDFQASGRPDNIFTVTVKPGEVFSQDMQSGTLRYNQALTLYSGLSLRYDLTQGFELGVSYVHALGTSQLERRVVSFCENCPVNLEAAPERFVDSEANTISISGRFTF